MLTNVDYSDQIYKLELVHRINLENHTSVGEARLMYSQAIKKMKEYQGDVKQNREKFLTTLINEIS